MTITTYPTSPKTKTPRLRDTEKLNGVEASYSDHDYSALLNNLPVGVYRNTPGPKGHFLEVNAAMLPMFGARSKEELLKHNVSDFYVDAKARKVISDKILKQGFIKGEQLQLKTLRGKNFIASVTAMLAKDPNGDPYFDGIIEDITEQKKSEAIFQRKELQELLEQTLDNMLDGCQIISPDFRYIYVNKVVVRQGRKPKSELLGRTMMEAYPGIEKTRMFTYLKRCMRYKRLYRLENEFNFPDGSKGWFELKMEPVPEGVLIFSVDITKRKKYEEAIKEHNKRLKALNKAQAESKKALLSTMEELKNAKNKIELEKVKDRAILENIGDGLIAVDPSGKIMMINKTAESLLGQKSEKLRGRKITNLPMLDAEGRPIPYSKRPILSVLKDGRTIGPSVGEYYFASRDSRRFPLGLTVTPMKLNGKIIGAIEVFRDVSREQEIDRAKTEFVSIASHQLRTPLGIAKWYLEAILGEGYLNQLPESGRSYFDEIYKSNERVLKVVRELLSVSRIDQGRIKNNPKRTDILKLVKNIVEETRPLAQEKNIKFRFIVNKSTVPIIYVDPMHLHEAVQNLVVNALEYTPNQGTVSVIVDTVEQDVVIKVKDSGIGISKDDQPRLFTKFFRSQKAFSTNAGGSGLGLYVVKSYIEESGGKIWVESHEGKGTAFNIALPVRKDGT